MVQSPVAVSVVDDKIDIRPYFEVHRREARVDQTALLGGCFETRCNGGLRPGHERGQNHDAENSCPVPKQPVGSKEYDQSGQCEKKQQQKRTRYEQALQCSKQEKEKYGTAYHADQ